MLIFYYDKNIIKAKFIKLYYIYYVLFNISWIRFVMTLIPIRTEKKQLIELFEMSKI